MGIVCMCVFLLKVIFHLGKNCLLKLFLKLLSFQSSLNDWLWSIPFVLNHNVQPKWSQFTSDFHNCPCSSLSEVKSLSGVRLFATPWMAAYQAPRSMGFSRQEYWSGLPFPSPGDLPNPGIEPRSPALQTDALPSEPPGKTLAFFNNKTSKLYPQHRNICVPFCYWTLNLT